MLWIGLASIYPLQHHCIRASLHVCQSPCKRLTGRQGHLTGTHPYLMLRSLYYTYIFFDMYTFKLL